MENGFDCGLHGLHEVKQIGRGDQRFVHLEESGKDFFKKSALDRQRRSSAVRKLTVKAATAIAIFEVGHIVIGE